MNRTVGWFAENLKIDNLDICDLKEWHPYAFAEGLADDNTAVELSEVEIGKLSPLTVEEICKVLENA